MPARSAFTSALPCSYWRAKLWQSSSKLPNGANGYGSVTASVPVMWGRRLVKMNFGSRAKKYPSPNQRSLLSVGIREHGSGGMLIIRPTPGPDGR